MTIINFDKVGLKESSWVVRLWYAWFSPWFEAGYAYKRYAYKKSVYTIICNHFIDTKHQFWNKWRTQIRYLQIFLEIDSKFCYHKEIKYRKQTETAKRLAMIKCVVYQGWHG